MPLDVLYHDEHFVAIDKPPGLLVHRSPISRDRVFALQTLRDQLGRHVFPVHRLDRATSGVLLFGLSAEAARLAVEQFEHHAVDKCYLAVARGWVDERGLIDHPVTDDDGNGIAQSARTRYRCLSRIELPFAVDRYPSSRYSLVAVMPDTGRRQQIRRHFKHISHHLIGDTTHGNGRHNRLFRTEFDLHHLLLRATGLSLLHPYSGQRLRIRAGSNDDWDTVARLFDHALADRPISPT